MVCELHDSKDVTSYFVKASLANTVRKLSDYVIIYISQYFIIIWPYTLSFPPPAFGSCFWHVQWCREDEVQISFAAQALRYRPCLSAVGEPTGTMSQIDLLKMPTLHKSSHFFSKHSKALPVAVFPAEADGRVTETVWRTDAILQTPDVSKRPLPHV